MSGINQITVVGHVGSAPELRYGQNNTPFCRFSVAVNEQWTKDGEKRETVTWFPVIVFNSKSAACARWLTPGRLVGVTGKVRTREYESKDGTKHQVMQILADNVTFLGTSKRGESRPAPGKPERTAAPADNDEPF